MRRIAFVFLGVLLCGCGEKRAEVAQSSIAGKVLICGVGRDIEKAFPFTRANIENIGSLFDDYRVFIYENNSVDRSVEELSSWARENSRVHVTCETVDDEILSQTCFIKTIQETYSRPERIARARNIVIDQIMDKAYDDFAYVIWIDLDFAEVLDLREICHIFAKKDKWDAVFANGVDRGGNYFDSFALRDQILPFGSELIGDYWWKLRGRIGRLKLTERNNWYPVTSAFGGMGIYKKKAIEGCRYSATVTPDLEALLKMQVLQGEAEDHFEVRIYREKLKRLKQVMAIPELKKDLYRFDHTKDEFGFTLGTKDDGLVFLMSSGIGQYPSVCEHVPFHASMILRGYNRLYIDPNLVLHYEERGDGGKKRRFKFHPIKYIQRIMQDRKMRAAILEALE